MIHYQGDFAQLLISAAEAGLGELIDLEMGGEPLEPLVDRLLNQSGAIEQKLLSSTGGQVDVKTFAMLGLMLAAGIQLFRGQIFGPAVPLLWYTAEIVRNNFRNGCLASTSAIAETHVPSSAVLRNRVQCQTLLTQPSALFQQPLSSKRAMLPSLRSRRHCQRHESLSLIYSRLTI